MLIVERGYRGMDTACKSVTFAAEIGTWLDSNNYYTSINVKVERE